MSFHGCFHRIKGKDPEVQPLRSLLCRGILLKRVRFIFSDESVKFGKHLFVYLFVFLYILFFWGGG